MRLHLTRFRPILHSALSRADRVDVASIVRGPSSTLRDEIIEALHRS